MSHSGEASGGESPSAGSGAAGKSHATDGDGGKASGGLGNEPSAGIGGREHSAGAGGNDAAAGAGGAPDNANPCILDTATLPCTLG